jgi:phospholipid/cholesterol/gamma-HCH transport system permease protein
VAENSFISLTARTGRWFIEQLDEFGEWCLFCGQAFLWLFTAGWQKRTLRRTLPQFYLIGTRSILVVMVTGAFVGAVLAVQTVSQFRSIGMGSRMGTVVNMSVLRELGPVLAGVMLAGRVGGGLTAELGTMRVTEQIDALRAMGTDPIRVLVVPRLMACVLLIPALVIYANFMGIMGGYAVSVYIYEIDASSFWNYANVEMFDLVYGPIKSLFFGIFTSLICCYKGFHCRSGAAGVGRACTESFVASCMAVLALDLLLGMGLNTIYLYLYGTRQLL